ncbi:chromosome partition protein Smc [Latilactobacillus sakei]|uniref:Chromosome partition protein Smc n=1 Tax=Latilactobacillus sakei TaxID=1599 RepID=A0AAF0K4L7_LATSK|nr:chromosome segregation protein SMC [Latilactobacillus sakei]MCB4408934.1 chromosome segregation protein SMC [Latilactobacillus sakei]QVQ49655.1 chromosome segregation protein SMC [Latilactobacillus sakei subsp. sakei]USF99812.1 chromosome segregation protein SMC [Latilactobacillus sakei subsp. sakei]WGI19876.1 chromosome segregation protein SMC [Latilactobacillus sakei]SON71041.1 chromosome condensation and segregation SMC ATPase [Latilactobacillus sakei]
MQLKSLVLSGFKSFADKTEINFSDGLTGIVGPNGSGKSNITEAIRWAMGEQSAKSLRGEKMPDIIFAGTDLRPQMNRAEVTLNFDNSDHYLNQELDNVTLTRRLFRNGDSEFYLNQKSCRLKDIVNLFMDSGLGRESFSIISQGRVEAIFNSKPEDRRNIIEEAAGVLKYKQQKKKAQSELDQTDENLSRIADIVYELKGQVEPLKEQSSIAQDYLEQKAQFNALHQQLLVVEIDQLAADQTQYQAQAKTLAKALGEIESEIQETNKALADNQQEVATLDQEIETANETLLVKSRLAENLQGQENVSKERASYTDANRQNLVDRIAQLETQSTTAKQQQIALKATYTEKVATLTDLKNELATLKRQASGSEAELKAKIEQIRQDYIDQMQAQTTNRNEQQYLEKALLQTKTQLTRQDSSINETSAQLTQMQADKVAKEAQVAQLATDYAALETQLSQLQQQISATQKQYQTEQNNWFQASGILQKAKAKQASLAELNDDYAGFYQGVKAVLKQKQQLPGLLGAVAELMTVPNDYQQAIELALGAQLQQIVTTDEKTAQQAIDYLKRNRLGRATFLPNNVVKPRTLPSSLVNQLQTEPGFIGIASDLIQFDDAVNPVMMHLMGNLIIATELTEAIKIGRLTGHRYRIVTLAGDILSPGGSMTGGHNNRQNNGGLLARKQTLTDLEQQISKMQLALDQKQTKVQALHQDLAEQQAQLEQQQGAFETAKTHYQTQKNELTLLNERLTQFERQQQATDYQVQQQQQSYDADLKRQGELQAAATEIEAQLTQLKADLDAANEQLQHFDQSQEQIRQQQTALETKLAVAQSEQKNVQEKLTDATQLANDLTQQLETSQQALAALQQADSEDAMTQKERRTQLKTTKALIQKLTAELATKRTARETLKATQQTLQANATRVYQLQRNSLAEQEQNAVALNRVKINIDQRLTTLREDYQLSYEAAKSALQASDLTNDQLKSKLKLLKLGLADLGTVNLAAIEDYQRVKERYDFLMQQDADLLDAKSQLLASMAEMDAEVEKRFKQTFDQTAAAFEEIFPMMFGGGHASLTLTDPSALLTSGIDIIAQPPGKKLQRLSLLSGGERALTAITLLFAILKVRPVPFCILDEVEASLDEANVDRFGRFMKRYESETQFIVITHRKGTMTQANRLYGVTMAESGISKIVSVSLEEHETA